MSNSNKKKLVVLLSRIPFPLEKGDKLRAFYQIKELSLYYDVYLCALTSSSKSNKNAHDFLASYCKEILFVRTHWIHKIIGIIQSLFCLRPIQVGLFHNCFTHRTIQKWIKVVSPDALYVQLHRMAPYVQNSKLPKVLDFQDAFSMGVYRRIDKISIFLKPIFWLEYNLLKRYESVLLRKFKFKTIISEVDRKWIDGEGKESIHIVLNGVDFDFYQSSVVKKDIDLLFTGNMGYMPNIDASEFLIYDIMPIVWKRYPTMNVFLAGANPHSRVQSLTSTKVTVTGFVDDLRPYYQRAKIFIAPMRMGSGLQNKLLEAMAMKIPSITSDVANKSLKAIDGQDVMVANNAVELADSILRLVEDEGFATTVSTNAFSFVSRFDWKGQCENLHQIIEKAILNK